MAQPLLPGGIGSSVSAQLAADLAVVAGADTSVLLLTLGLGTWLVTGGLTAVNGAATAGALEAFLVVDTATATFAGQVSQSTDLPALLSAPKPLNVSCLVTVTVAGSISYVVRCVNACTVKSATPTYAFPDATGLLAVQIA